jgi:hypothetical protein
LSSFQWGSGRGIHGAAPTAAQPAPALRSFSWGEVNSPDFAAVLTVARPAAVSPPAVGPTMPTTTTVDGAGAGNISFDFLTITLKDLLIS